MRPFLILTISSFLFIDPIFSQSGAEKLVENHLRATGTENIGKEILQYSIKGEFLQNKMKFPITIRAKSPDKYRMDMLYNNLNFIKISNGKTTWEYNPMNDSVKSSASENPVFEEFIQGWTGGIYRFKAQNIQPELVGATTVEDIEVYKLKVGEGKQTKLYYFDKLGFLLLRMDEGTEEVRTTYYRDYRKVGQYLLPYTMDVYVGDVPAMSMKFSEVKINESVGDDLFNRP